MYVCSEVYIIYCKSSNWLGDNKINNMKVLTNYLAINCCIRVHSKHESQNQNIKSFPVAGVFHHCNSVLYTVSHIVLKH